MDIYQFLTLMIMIFVFAILAIGATKTKNDDLLLGKFWSFLLSLKKRDRWSRKD